MAVCRLLLEDIDRRQPLSSGMREIRRVVLSFMKEQSGAFDYSLVQNWPNPFNPSTTIRFVVPEELPAVSLRIFNILGQLVWEKGLTGVLPGPHEVEWSGTTTTGESLASGVYFYQLRAGSYVSTRKLLMLR